MTSPVAKDWENRQFTQDIELSIVKLVDFLNNFETTIRGKASC